MNMYLHFTLGALVRLRDEYLLLFDIGKKNVDSTSARERYHLEKFYLIKISPAKGCMINLFYTLVYVMSF